MYYLTTLSTLIFNDFSPNLRNVRKKCSVDRGTITYLNETILKFLDNLKDNRLSLAIKRCGFESGAISFIIFDFFHLFVRLFIFFLNFGHN